jgi:hypothetical protein
MPRPAPAGLLAEFKKKAKWAPIVLMDIQVFDGTIYHWSDFSGNFPTALPAGGNADYKPWVNNVGQIRRTKALQTDAADISVQNISGPNFIDRDVQSAMRNGEFEGALAIVRYWHPLLQVVVDEQHGTLTDQGTTELEASFRHLQLLDTSQHQLPDEVYSDQCGLRFKSDRCGSVGSAVICPKTRVACLDVTRAASERFNGVSTIPPDALFPTTAVKPIGIGTERKLDDAGKFTIGSGLMG